MSEETTTLMGGLLGAGEVVQAIGADGLIYEFVNVRGAQWIPEHNTWVSLSVADRLCDDPAYLSVEVCDVHR